MTVTNRQRRWGRLREPDVPSVGAADGESLGRSPNPKRSTPPAAFWFICAAIFALNALVIGNALVVLLGLIAAAAAVWAGFASLRERR